MGLLSMNPATRLVLVATLASALVCLCLSPYASLARVWKLLASSAARLGCMWKHTDRRPRLMVVGPMSSRSTMSAMAASSARVNELNVTITLLPG